jgi:hypothetical protein
MKKFKGRERNRDREDGKDGQPGLFNENPNRQMTLTTLEVK